ncbi:MAG: type III-A CRISPR-associated RAMP protein Csm4 [Chlorobi bacterium]|nr:type III-A CRISPR-associated RAMP protein Csm4 [Chlorobiota bacterium]
MKAILLIPDHGSRFHLGETSLDDTSDLLHADTLFSALTTVYALAFDSGAQRFIGFVRSGKLRFSSGLYAVRSFSAAGPNGAWKLFFPKPLVNYPETCDARRLKKIRYVSGAVLKAMNVQWDGENCFTDFNVLDCPSVGGEFIFHRDELNDFGVSPDGLSFRHVVTAPKVKVHTTDDKDRLYHVTSVQFNDIQCGVSRLRGAYCVLLHSELLPEEEKELMVAFRILADEGVGGERSSGCGQFRTVEMTDIGLPEAPPDPSCHLVLSPVSPADDAEFQQMHRYELFVRGGGSAGLHADPETVRKQARFIREGAVSRRPIDGRLLDISPQKDERILRYGMNFSISLA